MFSFVVIVTRFQLKFIAYCTSRSDCHANNHGQLGRLAASFEVTTIICAAVSVMSLRLHLDRFCQSRREDPILTPPMASSGAMHTTPPRSRSPTRNDDGTITSLKSSDQNASSQPRAVSSNDPCLGFVMRTELGNILGHRLHYLGKSSLLALRTPRQSLCKPYSVNQSPFVKHLGRRF